MRETKSETSKPKPQNGFEKGYEAEDIIGTTMMNGQILFLIKWYVCCFSIKLQLYFLFSQHYVFREYFNIWYVLCRKGIEETELVYSSEAYSCIPQLVIKFYESKVTWRDAAGDSCNEN